MGAHGWIASNAGGDNRPTVWHRAATRESRGEVSGRLLATYDVAACTGRTLGGCWGSTVVAVLPADAVVCKRCAASEGR